MDLNQALLAHKKWKLKLGDAILQEKPLDAVSIGQDACCELGQWLYGEGQSALGAGGLFTGLLESHRQFHKEAGLVAELVNAKSYKEAADKLLPGADFERVSSMVQQKLVEAMEAMEAKGFDGE